jgi:hypothetical protein
MDIDRDFINDFITQDGICVVVGMMGSKIGGLCDVVYFPL